MMHYYMPGHVQHKNVNSEESNMKFKEDQKSLAICCYR